MTPTASPSADPARPFRRITQGPESGSAGRSPLPTDTVLDGEFGCPLCGCVVSAFAPSCVECRAAFEDEPFDDALRRRVLKELAGSLLAFYDRCVARSPDDEELWYARGLHLAALGRPGEAFESLTRAATLNPSKQKIVVVRMRLLARSRDPESIEQLRSAIRDMFHAGSPGERPGEADDLDEFERFVIDNRASCDRCGASLPEGSARCPVCGGPPIPPTEAGPANMGVPSSEESVGSPEDPGIGSPSDSEAPAETWYADRPAHVSTPTGFRTTSRAPRSPRQRTKGASEGAVNGHTNGLVNGRGRVNGFINGRGRVNGLVNGQRSLGASAIPLALPRASRRPSYAFLGTAIVMAAVIVTALYLPAGPSPGWIAIDGSFDDWSSVPFFDVTTPARDPDVELARYASLLSDGDLYLYASTRGTTFGDPIDYDGLYFLLDADGDSSTGYRFAERGADVVIEAYGGNGILEGARAYDFPVDATTDWSLRLVGPSVAAAASPLGLEVRISTLDVASFDPEAFQVVVTADNFEGVQSRGRVPLTKEVGAILLEATPLTSVIGAGPTDLLEVRARGVGFIAPSDAWTVSSFSFNPTPGVATSLSATSLTVTASQPVASLVVSASAPGFAPQDVVEVALLGAAAPRPVVVAGEPARAYVAGPTVSKRVDGLFADWAVDAVLDADPSPVSSRNVDLLASGAGTSGGEAFFHSRVDGTLLGGAIPQRLIRSTSVSAQSNSTPEPPRHGEDVFRVYVDVNGTDANGLPLGGILADYLIEIRGTQGRITDRGAYRWQAGWIPDPGATLLVAKNSSAFEGSFRPATQPNGTRMFFEATDWAARGDATGIVPNPSVPAKAPGMPVPLDGFLADEAKALSLAGPPSVDGDCATSLAEYAGAGLFSSASVLGRVGTDGLYVYICLDVIGDITDNGGFDEGTIYFDTKHDGGATPQPDDRRFRVTSGSNRLNSEMGDGLDWIRCGASFCDGGNAAAGAWQTDHQVYEFKIRFANVWGTDTPATDQTAGFAVIALDDSGGSHTWGSLSPPADTNPGTWGHLVYPIPEFDSLLIPVAVLALAGLLRLPRNKRDE